MKRVFQCFHLANTFYVYDCRKNSIVKILKQEYELLTAINCEEDFQKNSSKLKRFIDRGFFQESTINEIKHSATDMIDTYVNNTVEQLVLQLTQDCNLRCQYCFYGAGNYQNRNHSRQRMDFETAIKAIDYLLEHSKDINMIYIAFYGGEPLLEIELMKRCINYIQDNVEGKIIKYSMTTNGTLINEEIMKLWIDNDFNVLISLDGNKENHNKNRIYANGMGTFEDIICNLNRIKELYPDFYQRIRFNTVITPETDFSNMKSFWDTNEVVKDSEVNISAESECYKDHLNLQYSDEYSIIYQYGILQVFIREIKNIDIQTSKLVKALMPQLNKIYQVLKTGEYNGNSAHPGGPCIAGAHRVFVSADGSFYPCEKVSEISQNMNIGHIETGMDIEKIKKVINVGKTTEDECLNCWAFRFCDMCAAFSDNTIELLREKRLENCINQKQRILTSFRQICMLEEFGFDFEQGGEIDYDEVNHISI